MSKSQILRIHEMYYGQMHLQSSESYCTYTIFS